MEVREDEKDWLMLMKWIIVDKLNHILVVQEDFQWRLMIHCCWFYDERDDL